MAGEDENQPQSQPQNQIVPNPQNLQIDINDPYYLHLGDNPGQVLVSSVFSGSGFGAWKRSMTVALEAKSKDAFIDGSLPKPPPDDPNRKRWIRCNAMVISWFVNSLSKDIGESVVSAPTACDMWNDLCERYGQSNSAQLYQVQQEINDLNQGTDSVTTYYTKLKKSWDELGGIWNVPRCKCGCTCGAAEEMVKFEQDRKVIKFLMGLNDSYKITRGGILQKPPLPSMSTVYSIMLQEERQREISSQTRIGTDASAFAAQKGYGRGQQNYSQQNQLQHSYGRGQKSYSGGPGQNQQRQGNYQAGNSSGYKGNVASQNSADGPKCSHCGKRGHISQNCFDLRPYLLKEYRDRKKGFGAVASSQGAEMVGTGQSAGYQGQQMNAPQTYQSNSKEPMTAEQEYKYVLAGFGKLAHVEDHSASSSYALAAGYYEEEGVDSWAGA